MMTKWGGEEEKGCKEFFRSSKKTPREEGKKEVCPQKNERHKIDLKWSELGNSNNGWEKEGKPVKMKHTSQITQAYKRKQ